MLRIFYRVLIISVGFGATLSSSALAQQMNWKPFGEVTGWKVGSVSVDGGYVRCAAKAPGSAASIEKSSEGFTIVVPTKLPGDSLKGSIAVDGKSTAGEFIRMDDNRVGLFLKPAQKQAIQSAKSLIVSVRTETTALPLDNIGIVMQLLVACDSKGGV